MFGITELINVSLLIVENELYGHKNATKEVSRYLLGINYYSTLEAAYQRWDKRNPQESDTILLLLKCYIMIGLEIMANSPKNLCCTNISTLLGTSISFFLQKQETLRK